MKIALHRGENEENFGLHSISAFLCGIPSALALSGKSFLCTHTHTYTLFNYFHSPDESSGALGVESTALDWDRAAALLCWGHCRTSVPLWPLSFPVQGPIWSQPELPHVQGKQDLPRHSCTLNNRFSKFMRYYCLPSSSSL